MRTDRKRNGPIRTLIVRGEPSVWNVRTDYLENWEETQVVGVTGNGQEGLRMALRLEPDLIFMNLVLEGISGLSLAEQYRRQGGTAKILGASDFAGGVVIRAAARSGIDYMLVEPFVLGEIPTHIRLLCGGGRVYDDLLERMGMQRKLQGRSYLVRMAELMELEPGGRMKGAYYQVAEEFGTSYENLEKSIRYAIAELHRQRSPLYRQVVGEPLGEKAPSNGTFLEAMIRAAKIPL